MHHLSPVRWCVACRIRYITGSRRLKFGRAHVDLRPQGACPVGELAGLHAAEQVEVLLHRAVAVRAVLAALDVAAVLRDLLGRQVADVRLALLDELLGPLVELVEVVGGVELAALPVGPEPADVVADGIDVLLLLLGGVGVVVAQVALAAVLHGEAEVQADRLGVADVQVAVRLRREARVDAAAEPPGAVVLLDDLLDEVQPRRVGLVAGSSRRCRLVLAIAVLVGW